MNSDEGALSGAAELFKALSATSRLLILCALAHEPSSVSALAEATKLSQPLVSQHLRLLRGSISSRRRGPDGKPFTP
ncbi:ArsR/SmtB family transcription factor [Arthrobacter pascens]|uniref:ArsR/SmtB family transcription factor n=1 Tax=Arthrobacter pascens TaxID=1677 RepID=UPI0027D7B700|nr:metalloregulator ArsR/SmtB family transcription factor [Arthrobacter pascens]